MAELKNIDDETMKQYMREYRRKLYNKNPEKLKEKNKLYYYKYKFDISSEEMKRYDKLLPSVVKVRKELDHIMNENPSILLEILEPYLPKY
jgi:hypothetical protein